MNGLANDERLNYDKQMSSNKCFQSSLSKAMPNNSPIKIDNNDNKVAAGSTNETISAGHEQQILQTQTPLQQQQQPQNCSSSNSNQPIELKSSSVGESEQYWKVRHDRLLESYQSLQKINQGLEEKLLNFVEAFENEKKSILIGAENEKQTLIADVNKLSTKLVDARIKLHDIEERNASFVSQQVEQSTCFLNQRTSLPDSIQTISNHSKLPAHTNNSAHTRSPSCFDDPNVI